jgi:hypothetical protein
MLRVTTLIGAALLVLAGCADPMPSPAPLLVAQAPPVGSDPPVGATRAAISAEDVYTRVAYLASDELRGRDTPSPGLEAAAAYIVRDYERLGLLPAGDEGTFIQRWPLAAFSRNPESLRGVTPPNVVAVIRGSDPVLRDEYVVLTAHLDHVGVGRPVNGDSIYNGADDNASGTAALMEIAEAMVASGTRPARSVMFLHVSGEELGLLGSRWFSDNPTVPIGQIVANINADMIGRNAPDTIVVIGKDYSTLGRTVNEVAARHPELGLTVSDDIWPQERFFFRSDHFNFARKEIPALFFFSGVHEDYHRPSDTVDKLDTDKVARVAQIIYHTTLAIANDPNRPEWDPRGLAEVRSMTR